MVQRSYIRADPGIEFGGTDEKNLGLEGGILVSRANCKREDAKLR